MGQAPTEDELFQMISEVDDNMSGSIDFGEFLKVVESQKNRAENLDDENDMVDAFVACGGQADKSGHVKSKYYCWIFLVLLLIIDTHKHILTYTLIIRRNNDQDNQARLWLDYRY